MNSTEKIKKITNHNYCFQNDVLKNPYRILTEENGKKVAYIFSCPIHSFDNYELVSSAWSTLDTTKNSQGINSSIFYSDKKIVLENFLGRSEITFSNNYLVEPTTNGIVLTGEESDLNFKLTTQSAYSIKNTPTALAFMIEKHLPFLTITPSPAVSQNGNITPTFIEHIKQTENEYYIHIFSQSPCQKISVEINLYLPKLIFDTTIETKYPKQNNVYGSYALLGESDSFGEQFLLLRPNTSNDTFSKLEKIEKAELFIPKLGGDTTLICAHEILHGWCTFNTNFETRPAVSSEFSVLKEHSGYLVANITELLKNKNFGLMLENHNKHALCAISTGDSYEHPIIIKIQYN